MTQNHGEVKQNTMGNRLNGKVTPSHEDDNGDDGDDDNDDDDDDNDNDDENLEDTVKLVQFSVHLLH